MSVPTNLIPTTITGLQEYTGSSTLGYMPYILDGRTYKVQFANIAAVGAVPSTRVIAAGTGLAGGGDLSANRVISIAAGGVGFDQLALSGVVQGTYGSGSAVPVLTVDAKGRVTSATTLPLDVTGFVPTSRTVTAGDGLTGGGSLASNVTLSANFSASTPSALGIASAGTAITVSRGDHVHPAVNLSDTTQTQGALPLGRGGTGDALSPVAGAVVYSTGTRFALTNPGLPGQFLVSNGTDEPQWQTVPGTGTVTSVAVATANGFAGFVANPNTVAVITLQTTVTGLLKGNGTEMLPATAGIDYVAPGAYTTSGLTMATARLLGRTTASVGAAQEITVGTGLTLASGSLVNAAPDQVVSLTGAGTTTVTGTYPSFTITSNDSTVGTVTSVNASGGTTGLTFTGGPVTTSGTLTLGGTLAVVNGGTGATSAASALTNLGAYPASNPAGYTSNVGTVTSVSGTGTVSGLSLSGTVTSTGSLTLGGTLAVLPSNFASQTANTVLAAPNGSAGVPTFRAIVAADIPTLNQNTTGTASNVTGIVAVLNGGTGASIAGTARTNLGAAASGANTDITSIALTSGTISATPTSGTDIVNKTYADTIASGINFHQAVRLATTTTLPTYVYNNGASGVGATITGVANGALSIDGVAAVVGNRVLIKNEISAAAAYNGVYTVTQIGGVAAVYILTRATDYNTAGSGVNQIDQGDFFLVTAGTTQANTSFVQQTPLPIVVGTTALTFIQFGAPITYSAGTGLTLAGTVFSITNTGVGASTYGSASSVPVIAVNAQGQLTSASSSAIAIATSQVTSGTFTVGQGGTGATTLTGYVKGNGTSAFTASATIPAGDITGAALTKTDDTNVTLTLGGSPTTALLAATSITAGWTGQLAVARGGTGASTLTANGILLGNGTSAIGATAAGTTGQVLVGNTGAAPTWATLSSSAVTSFSAGSTGLTPSTATTGTITLAGTLNVANGGTGATTLTSGYLLKGNGTSAVSASVVYDTGTNVGIGTASPGVPFEVAKNGTNSGLGYSNVGKFVDGSGNKGLLVGYDNSAQTTVLTANSTAASSNMAFWTYEAGGSGWAARMSIASDGITRLNVGGVANTHQFFYNESGGEIQLIDSTGAGPILLDNVSGLARFLKVGSGSMAIGTTSTGTLRFQTVDVERMRVGSDGNVAIGTTSTGSARLTVTGGNGILVNGSGAAGYNVTQFINDNAITLSVGVSGSTAGGWTTNLAHLGTVSNSPLAFGTNSTERMRIQSTGEVGIGTTSFVGKLSVSMGDATSSGAPTTWDATYAIFGGTTANAGAVGIGYNSTDGGVISALSPNVAWRTMNYQANIHRFLIQGGEQMRLNASGNLGLGTSAPTVRLDVVGNVLAREDNSAGATPVLIRNSNTGNNTTKSSSALFQGTDTVGTVKNIGSVGFFPDDANYIGANLRFLVRSGDTTPTERMRLTAAGRLGIGVTSPAEALDVKSQINVTSPSNISMNAVRASNFGYSTAYSALIIGSTSGNNTPCINVDPIANASGSFSGLGGEVMFRNGVSFITPNAANTSYNRDIFSMLSGNVGIGTIAPATRLDVQAASNVHLGVRTGELNAAAIQLNAYNDAGAANIQMELKATSFVFNRSGTEAMRINTSGELLVGTSSGGRAVCFSSSDMWLRLAGSGRTWLIGPATGSVFNIYDETGGVNRFTIDTSGNINAYNSMFLGSGQNNDNKIEIGSGRTGSNYAYIDLIGDTTYTDYGLRLIRGNGGANTTSQLVHRGTGDMYLTTQDNAPMYFQTNSTTRIYIENSGNTVFAGLIAGRNSASTDVNSANDTGSISVRGSTTTVASVSFHRVGAFAINMGLGTDNVFRIGGWSASSNAFQMDGSGNLTMLGNVTAYSDIRMKKDVVTIDNALDLVGKMRGVKYTRKDTGKAGVGVIAQEMLEVLPEVVQQGIGDDDTLSVAYGNLVGVLIEAIKELEARVAQLEGK